MSSFSPLSSPKTVFGRAFLAELSRGNMERAILFARAFLAQEENPTVRIIEDPLILAIAN
jgi:hypothetical protein